MKECTATYSIWDTSFFVCFVFCVGNFQINNTFWPYTLVAILMYKSWQLTLITCVIVLSHPRRLFSFYTSSNGSHYHVTMTSHNDLRTWCHERKVRFLLKRQTSAHTTPRTRAFITLHNDRWVWTDGNSVTGIDRHWVRHKFN